MSRDPLDFRDADAFGRWLVEHGATATEAHLFIYKKGSRDRGIGYEDAVCAALCHGWIDSVTRRFDEARFVQRFTPRKPTSNWSASNIRRMAALLAEDRVTEAGLDVFDAGLLDRLAEVEAAEKARREGPTDLPDFARAIVEEDPDAAARFDALPPSQRRQYVAWIRDAKRQPTRERRTLKMMQMLRDGRSLSEL